MILAVPGSVRSGGTNVRLLHALAKLAHPRRVVVGELIEFLPLFTPEAKITDEVVDWRQMVHQAEAVIFCTPEYLHNLPAALKSALEWLTTGGELADKPVVALTATPHSPRGERAMQSLLWSLEALNARVVAQMPVYDVPSKVNDAGDITDEALRELLMLLLEQI